MKNNITVVVNNLIKNVDLIKRELKSGDVFMPIVYSKYPSKKIHEILIKSKTEFILFINPSVMIINENIISRCRELIEKHNYIIFSENDDMDQDFKRKEILSIQDIDSALISKSNYRRSLRDLSQSLDFTRCIKEIVKIDRNSIYFPSIRNTNSFVVKNNINNFINDIKDNNDLIVKQNSDKNIAHLEGLSAIKSYNIKKEVKNAPRPIDIIINEKKRIKEESKLTVNPVEVKVVKKVKVKENITKENLVYENSINQINFENINIREIILDDDE